MTVMRCWCTSLNLALLLRALLLARAFAQVQVQPDGGPIRVFGAQPQTVALRLHNPADSPATIDGRIRLLQSTSATAVCVVEEAWKKLDLPAGKTVIESATVNFPAVKAETRFLIQWLADTNKVFGITEFLAYPTNLLAEFRTLAGDQPLGLFDPQNELKLLFRPLAVEFQDLVEDGTDHFQGRLAIFGPFSSRNQMRASLTEDIRTLAKRGVAVVWLQPPVEPYVPLAPSFYTVRVGDGAVIVAQHAMVSRLAENPTAQLNLLQLAETALHPEPWRLPDTLKPN